MSCSNSLLFSSLCLLSLLALHSVAAQEPDETMQPSLLGDLKRSADWSDFVVSEFQSRDGELPRIRGFRGLRGKRAPFHGLKGLRGKRRFD